MKKTVTGILGAAAMALSVTAAPAFAQEQLTLKSAKTTSSYYMMMVQLAEMMKVSSKGEIIPTVEESQGSVQNVKESFVRPGNFLFTTPPSLLAAAREGKKPFAGKPKDTARTLFPMPFITIHFVVKEDSPIKSVMDLKGATFVTGGKGTFCQRTSDRILETLGIGDTVKAVDLELSAANAAMRNNKIDGFATCSSHPTPQLVELATTNNLRILSFTDEERSKVIGMNPKYGPLSLPANTYKGQTEVVETMALPVGAYGTDKMSDKVAYTITKTFWEWKGKLAKESSWWSGVTEPLVAQLGAKLHPGAAKYYEEIGVTIPDEMK